MQDKQRNAPKKGKKKTEKKRRNSGGARAFTIFTKINLRTAKDFVYTLKNNLISNIIYSPNNIDFPIIYRLTASPIPSNSLSPSQNPISILIGYTLLKTLLTDVNDLCISIINEIQNYALYYADCSAFMNSSRLRL